MQLTIDYRNILEQGLIIYEIKYQDDCLPFKIKG